MPPGITRSWIRSPRCAEYSGTSALGGDPRRVTIFGQSAGAISMALLLTSPLAKGLFVRAMGESDGLGARWRTFREAETQGEQIAAKLSARHSPTCARFPLRPCSARPTGSFSPLLMDPSFQKTRIECLPAARKLASRFFSARMPTNAVTIHNRRPSRSTGRSPCASTETRPTRRSRCFR